MTASENRTGDAPGAETAENLRSPEEPAAEPSDDAEQVSADRSSIPDTTESAPPKEGGEEPAGPSADNPAELRERLLRALAEQQNFQRRLERERDDAVRFAATELVKELLQTADNLSRALQSVTPGLPEQNEPLRNLLAGVGASERALQDTFAKHGIRRIQPALGEAFDPNQHQAMFEVEGSGASPGRSPRSFCPAMPTTNGYSVRLSSGLPDKAQDDRPETTQSNRS